MPVAPHPEHHTELAPDLVQIARETAYDRYIQALLIKPKSLRRDFLILAAFHGEVARIPLLVREPMMGEIRLQWWQDMVAATQFMAADAAPDFGSPLANDVADLIARHPETRPQFLQAIDARRAELDVDAFAYLSDFESYLDGAGGALLGVGLTVLKVDQHETATQALRAAGRAVACAELALRLPRLAALGRLPNVRVQMQDEERAAQQTAQPARPEHVADAIEVLAGYARTSVEAYNELQPGLSTTMIQAVLPLALVKPYFNALQGQPAQTLQAENPKSPLARFFRLWWAARRQRI